MRYCWEGLYNILCYDAVVLSVSNWGLTLGISDDIMVVYPSLSDAVAASTPAADSHLLSVLLLCWVLCAWWEERRVREGRVRGGGGGGERRGGGEESKGGEGEGRVNGPIGEIFCFLLCSLSQRCMQKYFSGRNFFFPSCPISQGAWLHTDVCDNVVDMSYLQYMYKTLLDVHV